MTTRFYDTILYSQASNIENELESVTVNGQTTVINAQNKSLFLGHFYDSHTSLPPLQLIFRSH